jgi:hypothetical protein
MGNHGYDILTTNPLVNASGFGGLPAATPDPRFANVWQFANNGYSNYNALAAVFRRAFGRGFQGQVSYTWSHALDTVSNGGFSNFNSGPVTGQINPANLQSLNYSNADYDVRHNLTGEFIWQSPVRLKNRLMNVALGGWSAGGRVNARTGTPFSVLNYNLSGGLDATVLADVIDPKSQRTCGSSGVNTPCFTAGEFAPAATQTNFGNLPRNSFRGPGFFDIDLTLYKTVPVGERIQFTFGASAYNLLNHPNFASPNANVGGYGLGLITSTTVNPSGPYGLYGGPSGRAVMVSGKFRF